MMWNPRYYWPLLGFVLPTLVVGYGFVIPSSCIRGVNALSVGFGTTVLGAVVTYVAGIRAATAVACPSPRAFRGRFARYLNRQASHPKGIFGWLLGVIWSLEHRRLNRVTLDLLEIRPTDHVLDVGCGSGTGVREATRRAARGAVMGVDVSATILSLARHRNRNALNAGRVSFRQVRADDFELVPESFDRIFSVHSIYFWKDPADTLRQLATALHPGGRLVLAFRPEGPTVPARFRDATYRFYTAAEVRTLLLAAGFHETREVNADPPHSATWIVADKPARPRST